MLLIENINYGEDENGDNSNIADCADDVNYDKLIVHRGWTLHLSKTASAVFTLLKLPLQRCDARGWRNCSRHLYYLTLGANPVTLHVICLVIIMQMVSGAALADLYYIASSLSVIHNSTPGANWGSIKGGNWIKYTCCKHRYRHTYSSWHFSLFYFQQHPNSIKTLLPHLVHCLSSQHFELTGVKGTLEHVYVPSLTV